MLGGHCRSVAIRLFFSLSELLVLVPGAPASVAQLAAHSGRPQNAPADAEARNRHGAPVLFLIEYDTGDDDVGKRWRFIKSRRRRNSLRRRNFAPDEAGQVQAPRLPSHGTKRQEKEWGSTGGLLSPNAVGHVVRSWTFRFDLSFVLLPPHSKKKLSHSNNRSTEEKPTPSPPQS